MLHKQLSSSKFILSASSSSSAYCKLFSTATKQPMMMRKFLTTTTSPSLVSPLRQTQPLLGFVMNPEKIRQTASTKNRISGGAYGDIDPERMREFEEMQMGMTKRKIEQERQEKIDFLNLPREEQIRRFMLSKRKFDVDLVRKNGMNVAEEFEKFKKDLKKMDKKATRGFWIPFIVSTLVIWGGSAYWVFWWY